MATLPAASVDAIITSPPYAMQRKATYGGIPEAEYPAWTVAWMREARRLLRPDGSIVINIRPHVRDGQISDYTLRTRLALRDDGWAEIDELIWHKLAGAPLGHTGRPRRSWESLHWFAHHGRPYAAPKAAGTPTSGLGMTSGRHGPHIHGPQGSSMTGVARVPDVVSLKPTGSVDHPAPYPPALAEWVAHLVCPPGGTVLDPFNGSGSTGVAALRNGWRYIGIDSEAEYIAMTHRRLSALSVAPARSDRAPFRPLAE